MLKSNKNTLYYVHFNNAEKEYEVQEGVLMDYLESDGCYWFHHKEDAEKLSDLLNGYEDTIQSLENELTEIKESIDDYIKSYEEFDDFFRHDPRKENHTIKHLSYVDMQKKSCSTVLGILWHLKEHYYCPKCRSNRFYIEPYYPFDKQGEIDLDGELAVKEECYNCDYLNITKRQIYRNKEWR